MDKAKLAKLLGLAEDASEEEIERAIDRLAEERARADLEESDSPEEADAPSATPADLAALAAQVETDAKAAMVAQAVAQGKAVTLAESVLAKMTREETAAYLSALPETLPVASVLPRSNREAPAGVSIGARQAACVAEVRRAHPSWRYEDAWDEAERLHPELFKQH